MRKLGISLGIFLVPFYAFTDQAFHAVFAPATMQLNPIYAISAAEAQLFTAIHEGLVSNHPQYLYPVPAMAESWDISADGTVYTFHLRDDLFFSDGEKITAQDFVRSWMQQLKVGERAMFASMFDTIKNARSYRLNSEGTVGLHAPSELEFRVELEAPTPHFLKLITHHSFTLVHPSLLEEDDWYSTSLPLITSGPYKIQSLEKEEFLLVKNEYYHSATELSEIKITFAQDPEALTEAFNQRKVDWILSPAIVVKDLDNTQHIVLNESFSSEFLFFRVDVAPWNNSNVRKALALLLPWEQIRQPFLLSQRPTSTIVPRIDSYPLPHTIPKQDVTTALQLLSEEGFSDDHLLPPIRIVLPSLSPEEDLSLENILRTAWSPVSEEVEIGEQSNIIPFLQLGEYTIGSLSWIGDYTDPLAFLELWLADSELNFSHYKDDTYEDLIQESMRSKELDERYTLLSQAESMLLEQAVVLPLHHGTAINIIDTKRVKGWYPNPLDIHPFATIRLEEYEPTSSGIVSR